MATLTIPVDRVAEQATQRRLDARRGVAALGRLLLALLVGVPYVLGWSAGRVWLGLTIVWVAIGEGWRDAARSRPAQGGRR